MIYINHLKAATCYGVVVSLMGSNQYILFKRITFKDNHYILTTYIPYKQKESYEIASLT